MNNIVYNNKFQMI